MKHVARWSIVGLLLALLLGAVGWAVKMSAERALLYAPLPATTPTPTLPTPTAQDTRFVIQSVDYMSRTVRIAFTAKQIKGDWLFETPVLRVGKRDYTPSPTSLRQARLDLLKTITAGQAASMLEFEKVADETSSGTLVLNPDSQPANIVSPRLELDLTWRVDLQGK